jgi:hypothetical protein
MRRRLVTLLGSLLLLMSITLPVGAQEPPAIIPVLASSEIAQGPNRFLFGLTSATGEPVAAPDVDVRLEFYDEDADPERVVFEAEARFLWAIEDVRGLYASSVEFPHPGRWATRFYATFPDGREETVRASYDVWEATLTPMIGTPARSIDTPTAADFGGDLSFITSDQDPEPRFYELSISDAIEADAPAILAFVTPAFCQTGTCGPTVEVIKAVAADRPEVNVVQVEPYVMAKRDGYLQPVLSEEGWLQAAPWTELWALRVEPYVVVIDAEGIVRAKFEGAITEAELAEALAGL